MKKKLLSLVSAMFVLAILLCCIFTLPGEAKAATSPIKGTCGAEGSNLTWILDDAGKLTIMGTGAMEDYTSGASSAPWRSYRDQITSIVIKDGVTNIGNYAFYDCYQVKSTTIADSVTVIGDYAFYSCNMYSVSLPANLTTIGNYAFCDSVYLSSIFVPKSVTVIGNYAFEGCTSVSYITIFGSAASIGDYAFANCIELESVTLGDNITSIGDHAFDYCYKSLTEINIPGSVKSVGDYAFNKCYELTKLTIGEGVESIGDYAFYECYGIKSVKVPDTVTYIGYSAFQACTSLNSITIPFVGTSTNTSGPSSVFGAIFGFQTNYYEGLTRQYYGNESYDKTIYYFHIPKSLISVTVTNDKNLPYGAFSNCSELRYLTLPDNVSYIEKKAFYNCSKLSLVYVTDAAAWCNVTFADTTSNPANYAEKMLLYGSDGKQIRNLVLSGVSKIPAGAFKNFKNLTSVTILDGVDSIGEGAFSGCTSLQTITIPFVGDSRNTTPDNYRYSFGYIFGKDSFEGGIETRQEYYLDITESIIPVTYYVPGSLKTVNVTGGEIYQGAFKNCSGLTGVTLSDTVKTIGQSAFANCNSLTGITMPSSVTDIKATAFDGCNDLTNVFYKGTASDQENISLGNNTALTSAKWHYEFENTIFGEQQCLYCKECDNYYLPDGSFAKATVTFKNWNGDVLSSTQYAYKEKVSLPDTPSRIHDDPNVYQWVFSGWDKEVTPCTGNVEYVAVYEEAYVEYLVSFVDWNGAVLSARKYHYGDPVTAPDDPARAADETYTYTFSGWDNAVVDCIGDAIYTATYTPTYIEYTVVFKNWDSTVLSTKKYHYGDSVTAPDAPARAADETYTYTFSGWDKKVVACASDATYTAVFTPVYVEYTVVFKNWNGTVLSTKKYHYGDPVTAPSAPTRAADDIYTYTFAGWDQQVVACAGDATYIATYTPVYKEFTVVFRNWDGTVLSTETYHYGDPVTVPADPVREKDDYYTYTFSGWYKTVTQCTGDAVYQAVFTGTHYHNYSTQITDPTCTATGYTIYTCRCGNNYKDSYVDPLGHDVDDMSRWVVTREPTCTVEGCRYKYCSRCNYFETEPIAKSDHSYSVEVIAPTCTMRGYTTHTCQCDDYYEDSFVDALGHNLGQWVVTRESTCAQKGSKRRDCDRCNYYETEPIPLISHSYDDTVLVAPTCTAKGYTKHVCQCGDYYEDSFVDALGHDLKWVVTWEPTCGRDGTKRGDCNRCNYSETAKVPATGEHRYKNACDLICDVCNFVRDGVGHVYENDCDAICDVCGTIRTPGEHVYDNEDDRYCNICNYDSLLQYDTYNWNKTATITGINNKNYSGALVIPESINGYPVTQIGYDVFYGCTGLTSITFPGSLTHIGSYAFYGCTGLASVTFPEGLMTIGIDAFYGCTGLTSVTFPKGLTTIGGYAFYGCTGLTGVTFPKGLTTIGGSAFYGCIGLTSATFPKGLTTIGGYAFYGCTGLTSVTFPEGLTTIGDYAFSRTGLTSVTLPGSLTSIGEYAFYCTGLNSATFQEGVTTIGTKAFAGCQDLTSVSLPSSLTTIGDYAFDYTGLTSISFPEGLTTIGDYAFEHTGLTSISFPESLTDIGYYAFYGCTGLTSVVIPKNVSSLSAAFGGCTGLTSLQVADGNPYYYSKDNCIIETATKTLISGIRTSVIPADGSVTVIGASAFAGCDGLRFIRIPDGVTTIKHYAFGKCKDLVDVDIPNTVTEIEDGVFECCSSLVSVKLPAGLTVLNHYVFYDCYNLTNISIPKSVTYIKYAALRSCPIQNIYYSGSEADRLSMTIDSNNGSTPYATWYYNACEDHTFDSICDDTCKDCGWTRAAVEHDLGQWECVNATCTADGENRRECSRCDYYEAESIPATGHSYTKKVVAPTYTKQGYTQYTCKCGHSYKNSYKNAKGLPAPSVKIANDAKTGKPTISWKAVSEANSYVIYRATAQNGSYTKLATTTKTSYTDSSAALGKTYYYKVIAVCKSDSKLNSKYSAIVSAVAKCGQPTIKVSVSSKGKVTVSWGKVSGAKKYDVYYATSQNGTYKKLTSTTKTSYSHTKASAGKEYFYKVRAYSTTATTCAFSNVSRAVIKLATPSLTVTAKNGQATIKWKKITGATKYELQCSTNGGAYKTIATVSGTSYTHKGLAGGNKYAYRLRAVSSVKDAVGTYSAVKTVVVKCAAPTITVSLSGNAPVIKWSKVSGAVKYQVYYGTSKSGKYKLVATVTGTSYTHKGAPAAKACYYKVVAVDKNGNQGEYSSVKNISTKCLAPTTVKVTRNAKKQPVVTWSKVSGAKKYEVYVATSKNGTYKKLTSTNKLTYTYTKAKTGVTYYFKITAYGSSTATRSAYSVVVKTP